MEVVNDWKEFTFHKLLYCIWKFLAAHPSEGQSSLLSTRLKYSTTLAEDASDFCRLCNVLITFGIVRRNRHCAVRWIL